MDHFKINCLNSNWNWTFVFRFTCKSCARSSAMNIIQGCRKIHLGRFSGNFPLILGMCLCIFRLLSKEPIYFGGSGPRTPYAYYRILCAWNLITGGCCSSCCWSLLFIVISLLLGLFIFPMLIIIACSCFRGTKKESRHSEGEKFPPKKRMTSLALLSQCRLTWRHSMGPSSEPVLGEYWLKSERIMEDLWLCWVCELKWRVYIVHLSHGVNTDSLTPDQRIVAAIR